MLDDCPSCWISGNLTVSPSPPSPFQVSESLLTNYPGLIAATVRGELHKVSNLLANEEGAAGGAGRQEV